MRRRPWATGEEPPDLKQRRPQRRRAGHAACACVHATLLFVLCVCLGLSTACPANSSTLQRPDGSIKSAISPVYLAPFPVEAGVSHGERLRRRALSKGKKQHHLQAVHLLPRAGSHLEESDAYATAVDDDDHGDDVDDRVHSRLTPKVDPSKRLTEVQLNLQARSQEGKQHSEHGGSHYGSGKSSEQKKEGPLNQPHSQWQPSRGKALSDSSDEHARRSSSQHAGRGKHKGNKHKGSPHHSQSHKKASPSKDSHGHDSHPSPNHAHELLPTKDSNHKSSAKGDLDHKNHHSQKNSESHRVQSHGRSKHHKPVHHSTTHHVNRPEYRKSSHKGYHRPEHRPTHHHVLIYHDKPAHHHAPTHHHKLTHHHKRPTHHHRPTHHKATHHKEHPSPTSHMVGSSIVPTATVARGGQNLPHKTSVLTSVPSTAAQASIPSSLLAETTLSASNNNDGKTGSQAISLTNLAGGMSTLLSDLKTVSGVPGAPSMADGTKTKTSAILGSQAPTAAKSAGVIADGPSKPLDAEKSQSGSTMTEQTGKPGSKPDSSQPAPDGTKNAQAAEPRVSLSSSKANSSSAQLSKPTPTSPNISGSSDVNLQGPAGAGGAGDTGSRGGSDDNTTGRAAEGGKLDGQAGNLSNPSGPININPQGPGKAGIAGPSPAGTLGDLVSGKSAGGNNLGEQAGDGTVVSSGNGLAGNSRQSGSGPGKGLNQSQSGDAKPSLSKGGDNGTSGSSGICNSVGATGDKTGSPKDTYTNDTGPQGPDLGGTANNGGKKGDEAAGASAITDISTGGDKTGLQEVDLMPLPAKAGPASDADNAPSSDDADAGEDEAAETPANSLAPAADEDNADDDAGDSNTAESDDTLANAGPETQGDAEEDAAPEISSEDPPEAPPFKIELQPVDQEEVETIDPDEDASPEISLDSGEIDLGGPGEVLEAAGDNPPADAEGDSPPDDKDTSASDDEPVPGDTPDDGDVELRDASEVDLLPDVEAAADDVDAIGSAPIESEDPNVDESEAPIPADEPTVDPDESDVQVDEDTPPPPPLDEDEPAEDPPLEDEPTPALAPTPASFVFLTGEFTHNVALSICSLAAITAENEAAAFALTGGARAWIASWNGDDYSGSCIALEYLAGIGIPAGGCDEPLGILCEAAVPTPPPPPLLVSVDDIEPPEEGEASADDVSEADDVAAEVDAEAEDESEVEAEEPEDAPPDESDESAADDGAAGEDSEAEADNGETEAEDEEESDE